MPRRLLLAVLLAGCAPTASDDTTDAVDSGDSAAVEVPPSCDDANGGCDHVCDDTTGAIVCSCDPGHALEPDGATCVRDVCEPLCGDTEWCDPVAVGRDDDCDGEVDEGCACAPGTTQGCLLGDPSVAGEPGCAPGVQACGADGTWGACEGGLHAEDDCDEVSAAVCRSLHAAPFVPIDLADGVEPGGVDVTYETWEVACPDGVQPCPAVGGFAPADDFTALVSGEYTVTYTRYTSDAVEACTFPLFVGAPGLRVELAWEWPTNAFGTIDLDLQLHEPGSTAVWAGAGGSDAVCAFDTCTVAYFADGEGVDWFSGDAPPDAVDWYLSPVLEENTCYFGPRGAGADWQALGKGCHNPRLDLDNISCEPTRTDPQDSDFCNAENINVDVPPTDVWFRIGVHDYNAAGQDYDVHPSVKIFCDGRLASELGPRGFGVPEVPVTFTPEDGGTGFWLVADVAFVEDPCGDRFCVVRPLYEDSAKRTPVLTTTEAVQQSFGPAYGPLP